MKQIKLNKKYGDIKMVAEIMGVSRHNAARILERNNAKRHDEAVRILQSIIENREKLVDEIKTPN